MAIQDSRRLSKVLQYLYPNLQHNPNLPDCDYYCQNEGSGTSFVWLTDKVAKPTDEAINNAKEAALDAWWFKKLRKRRDQLLAETDWTQGTDVPTETKNKWSAYRQKLRDLPTTATKPSADVLNATDIIGHDIDNHMPTKPS